MDNFIEEHGEVIMSAIMSMLCMGGILLLAMAIYELQMKQLDILL